MILSVFSAKCAACGALGTAREEKQMQALNVLTRTDFWRQVQQQGLITPGQMIVIGVSTGVDSMTLLDLVQHAPTALHLHIGVVYVDHQLRAQSATETAFIQDYCAARKLPLHKAVWQHGPLTHGVEAAARDFRYQTFQTALTDWRANTLWLAHHNDDALETLLMKLARSGSVFEQPGLRLVSRRPSYTIIRPLLPYPKSAIRAYAARHQVPHYEDATNQDETIQRNRIRAAVVPVFHDLNERSAAHLLRYTEEMTAAQGLLAERLTQLAATMVTRSAGSVHLDRPAFNALPRGQRSLLLQFVLADTQPLTGRQLAQCLDLAASSQAAGSVNLAAGWQFTMTYQRITITRENQSQVGGIFLPVSLSLLGTVFYPDGHAWHLAPAGPGLAVPAEVVLRHRQPGDVVQLANGQHQLLRRFLINQKVPQSTRDTLVLAAVGEQVWYIPGLYIRQAHQLSGMGQPDTMKSMLTYY